MDTVHKVNKLSGRFTLAGCTFASGIASSLALIAALVLPTMSSVCLGQDPATEPVVRIEEDWQLVITEPDTNVAAPQIGTIMSPRGDLTGLYVIFVLNHRVNPLSESGGLELQFWNGDNQVGSTRLDQNLLDQENETITWTQKMMVKGSAGYRYVCFRVIEGQSATWGTFGGAEPLHLNAWTSLNDLSGYQSAVSVENSGITYGSNRVASLTLKAVRGYTAAGALVFEETIPVVVYQTNSGD